MTIDMTDIIAKDNACVQLTRGKLQDRISRLPGNFLEMDIDEIRAKIKPGIIDYLLRLSFQEELHKAIEKKEPMVTAHVIKDYCVDSFFYLRYITNHHRLAWLLRPMANIEQVKTALLARSYERLWEILELPLLDSKNKPIPKMADVILSTAKMIKETVEGTPIQRSESKTMSVSVKAPIQVNPLSSLEEIDKKIQLIEASGITDDERAEEEA